MDNMMIILNYCGYYWQVVEIVIGESLSKITSFPTREQALGFISNKDNGNQKFHFVAEAVGGFFEIELGVNHEVG